jgi:hypothetical protein
MSELRTLLFELRQFDLSLLERTVIPAPGKEAVRAGDRMTRERSDHDQGQRRQRHPADQSENAVRPPHATQRITKESGTQEEMDKSVSISWKRL